MKRPVVRNVRALRTERELIHARQAHAHARAARQKAASHRLVVACALLGAVLGTGVVAAATPFPWWPVLVPTALLALSMGAGRHAALASAQAEQRERARIAELEAEVIRLTGHRLPETRHTEVPEAGLRETALETAQEAGLRETGLPEARATETVARAAGADERVETQAQTVERAETAPMAKVVAVGSTAASESSTTVTATPPQGWEPVSVPAPTYTLVGTARRRRLDSVEQVTGGDGEQKIPVPVRPTAARPVAPIAVVTPHAPIDLDEVLERRRASGE